MADLGERLRAQGMRLTSQRARVLRAVEVLGHATPEEIVAEVTRDGEAPLALSTVYRSLEALQALGVLTHTHVDSRVPSYHLVSHATHIHLVCRGCGWVGEVPAGEGGALVARIDTLAGFRADLTHSALHGLCAACATDADTAPAAGSVSPPATAPTHDPQHPLTPKDSSS